MMMVLLITRRLLVPKICQGRKFDKIVLPKNLFDNKITLINYRARFDMRQAKTRSSEVEEEEKGRVKDPQMTIRGEECKR